MRKISVFVICVLFYVSLMPIVAETDEITAARIVGKNDAQGFKWEWFTAGYITANASVVAVVLAFEALNNSLDTIDPACWYTIYGAYILTPTAVALIKSPTPPAERLLGKSPEWVNAYTKAYKQTMRRHRAGSSAAGCVFGGTVLVVTVYSFALFFLAYHGDAD